APILAAARLDPAPPLQRGKVTQARIGLEHDVAAVAAVAPVGPALRHELLAAEREAAVAALTGLDVDLRAVAEHQPNRTRVAPWNAATRRASSSSPPIRSIARGTETRARTSSRASVARFSSRMVTAGPRRLGSPYPRCARGRGSRARGPVHRRRPPRRKRRGHRPASAGMAFAGRLPAGECD